MTGPDPGGFASTARGEARQILSGHQYQTRPEKSFDPLGGVGHSLGRFVGDVVDPPARWIWRHLLHPTGHLFSVAFGSVWPVVAVATAVIMGVVIAAVVISRRQRPGIALRGAVTSIGREDPQDLETLADRSEEAGDLQAAVRLRFRAGVIRLEQTGVVVRGSTRTTREIGRLVMSPTFEGLAADLESIVYAGAVATADQVRDAKNGWPVVVEEAGKSRDSQRNSDAA
jgi:hypothetical protein